MVVVHAYSIFVLLQKPYLRKGDDRLHLLCNTETFLLVLSGFIMRKGTHFSPAAAPSCVRAWC
jgi:hypothetical protein